MRWDDLQLLHLIDELEASEQFGSLVTGYSFMQATTDGRTVDWDRDGRSFVRELMLARTAGSLEWVDMTTPNVPRADPTTDAQRWLQEIRDLRLTLSGRDRARGRLFQRPLPDPEEDDDRPITGM